jgi:pimeloyl-ACP methyl ester carboxylesterase
MPRAENRDVSLYYETAGEGPTVAFVEDAGYGAWLWGWQHAALAGPFETLIWDLRGVARSSKPETGDYSVEAMAADLEAVLSDHGVRSAHVVGAGLGGMVALAYGLGYWRPETLTLFGTAAGGWRTSEEGGDVGEDQGDEEPRTTWAPRDDATALRESLAVSERFRREHPDVVEGIVEWRADEDPDREVWDGQTAAMAAFDVRDRLYEIPVPALVVHGTDDRVVPVDAGRRLAEGLPRGGFETVEGAGHLAFVERSRPVNDLLVGFLSDKVGHNYTDGHI